MNKLRYMQFNIYEFTLFKYSQIHQIQNTIFIEKKKILKAILFIDQFCKRGSQNGKFQTQLSKPKTEFEIEIVFIASVSELILHVCTWEK